MFVIGYRLQIKRDNDMKNKSYKLLISEYQEKYGDIPIEQTAILEYLDKTLKLTDKDYKKIDEDEEKVKNIPWDELEIILPIIPKPSPRPRYSSASGSFYVTGASENKKLFKYFVEEKYGIIYTNTHFSVTTYIPTPLSQMTKTEVIRAERGTISAMSNPDWDNLGKTYSDMIQQILILNDNIITKGYVEKYYSVKPRVVINIKYQQGFDSKFNKRRMLNSTNYKKYIEMGNIIELYTERNDIF